MDSWLIPASPVTFVEEIKKSRFITLLAHTDGVEAAKAFVESVRAEHPDARHHCVAWVAGPPNDSQQLGFSDDGEPAGTAGKPMLSQLMGSGIGEITAVVVRYYGGVLLGTGGLVKAYGGGVQQALNQLTTTRKTPLTEYTLLCINIDAEVTPAMEPTQSCSWHGEKVMSPEAATRSASLISFASPSNTSAPVTAPFMAPHMFSHATGGPACNMVVRVMPGTTLMAWS
jgi:uncharacterized YigZ family protein